MQAMVLSNLIEMTAHTSNGTLLRKVYHHTDKAIAMKDFRKYCEKFERDTREYAEKTKPKGQLNLF
jgi:hypothetical protein